MTTNSKGIQKKDNWLTKQDDDEILDLVDADDNVIGQQKRGVIYTGGKSNFRVINAFVENSQGQLWILRRSAKKRYFPLALDMSVGGHVRSAETYEDAFKRELKEELKIDLLNNNYQLLGHLTPQGNKVSSFMNVYKIFSDETPQFDRNEFIDGFWLTPDEIVGKIYSGDSAKDDLLRLLNIFYKDKIKTVSSSNFKSIRIKITDKCSLKCWYCHNEGTGKRNPKLVSDITWDEEISNTLDLFKTHLGVNEVHLTGGEPTLNQDILNIVRQTKQKGFFVKITSSGCSQETISSLFEAGISGINFSLHSAQPFTPSVDNKPNWLSPQNKDLLQTVVFSQTLGLKVKINMVVSGQDDYNKALDILEWSKQNNVALRLLNEIGSGEKAVETISKICQKLHAVEHGKKFVLGGSSYSVFYTTPTGYQFGVKLIRDYFLEKTLCKNCVVRNNGHCTERFYGIRLEKRNINTEKLLVRLCLHKTDETTLIPATVFFSSPHYNEVKHLSTIEH